MDINTLRGIATLLVFIGFIGICWWAYSRKRKARFDQAGELPFADREFDEQLRDPATPDGGQRTGKGG